MTNLKKRERAKTNASLISMVQRFSDITIMFAGLWLVCEVSGLSFLYMHLLVALITLVVFQMLGGITDFYRSWRGVRAATEFALLLQNWTLSVIFSAGLVAFNNDFDTQLKIWLAWYGLTSIGLVVCRSCIRIGAGWLRNHGYNKRMVAVAGDLAAGQMLMESFRNQPWLGFEVVGVYHDPKPGGVSNDWAGNLQQLVEDAKAGKIHNVYIAMQMCDGARVKKLVHQLADTTCSVLLIPDVFFRDFAYCDSGMIPWLLVAELVCLKGKTLGELVRDRMAAFPASGEINSKLAQPVEAINRVEQHFSREALAVDRTDGISMTFADWRFNLRSSNTEPVVRLNVESRGDVPLMEEKTKLILELLNK
ncbi:TPA: hypothetical protein ACHG1I_002323 [Escherichia coli]